LRVFVDTSAILALLVPSDSFHHRAKRSFERLQTEEAAMLTTSYVLLETYALLGRRLGPQAVRSFREAFAPLVDVVWVDRRLHEKGLDTLAESAERDLSLVDTVSFQVIEEEGIERDRVFVFDGHFEDRKLGLLF
jgi:predicted nucleic acid-binding protein